MNLTAAAAAHNPSGHVLDPTTVYIVDGDDSARDDLEDMLRSAGFRTLTAASAEAYLELPRCSGPSCLLVELHLPGSSGLELQRAISDRPEVQVVFMSDRADISAAVQAMKAGAFEFLTKPLAQDGLLNLVDRALARSSTALWHLSRERALLQRYDLLTRREREVLRLLIMGRLNKQVGGELGISEITVKAHRGKVMRKMQAPSFAALINMVAILFPTRSGRRETPSLSS